MNISILFIPADMLTVCLSHSINPSGRFLIRLQCCFLKRPSTMNLRQIVALPYSDTLPMMFPKKGIYLCSIDRNIKEGFTFLNFGTTYPRLTTPEVMIEPLAYLASQDEMAGLRSAAKPKAALDDFWIKCGGNVDKARELIQDLLYQGTLFKLLFYIVQRRMAE